MGWVMRVKYGKPWQIAIKISDLKVRFNAQSASVCVLFCFTWLEQFVNTSQTLNSALNTCYQIHYPPKP